MNFLGNFYIFIKIYVLNKVKGSTIFKIQSQQTYWDPGKNWPIRYVLKLVSNKKAILACFGLQILEMDFEHLKSVSDLKLKRRKTLISPENTFFEKIM